MNLVAQGGDQPACVMESSRDGIGHRYRSSDNIIQHAGTTKQVGVQASFIARRLTTVDAKLYHGSTLQNGSLGASVLVWSGLVWSGSAEQRDYVVQRVYVAHGTTGLCRTTGLCCMSVSGLVWVWVWKQRDYVVQRSMSRRAQRSMSNNGLCCMSGKLDHSETGPQQVRVSSRVEGAGSTFVL